MDLLGGRREREAFKICMELEFLKGLVLKVLSCLEWMLKMCYKMAARSIGFNELF